MELFVLVALFVLLCFLYIFREKGSKSPPGPRRIPLLGSIPFLPRKKGVTDWFLEESVTKHRISRVDLGPKQTYVINDFVLAKELLDKPEFSGRTPSEIMLMHRFINKPDPDKF